MAQPQALQAQRTAGDILIALHREQIGLSHCWGALNLSVLLLQSVYEEESQTEAVTLSSHTSGKDCPVQDVNTLHYLIIILAHFIPV